MDESILLPKIRKIQKNMKKINSSTQTPPKFDLVTFKEKVIAVTKPGNAMENKIESNKKILRECDMGYGIIEDIKKTNKIFLYLKCAIHLNKEENSWKPLIHNPIDPRMIFN